MLNYVEKGVIFIYTRLSDYTCGILQTCNIVFCCETSWSQTWQHAQQCVSTRNATMPRDKPKENAARITGPLVPSVSRIDQEEHENTADL